MKPSPNVYPDTCISDSPGLARRLDPVAQMVGRHEADRRRAQNLRPVERAAVQQHLGEPEIVARGGNEPHATRVVRRRGRDVDHLDRFAGGVRREGLGQPAHGVLRNMEARRVHLQWPEHTLLQEVSKALARRALDHAAEHIGGEAVFPDRPGLVRERRLRKPCDLRVGADLARIEHHPVGMEDAGFGIGLLNLRVAGQLAIGETGSVAKEVWTVISRSAGSVR